MPFWSNLALLPVALNEFNNDNKLKSQFSWRNSYIFFLSSWENWGKDLWGLWELTCEMKFIINPERIFKWCVILSPWEPVLRLLLGLTNPNAPVIWNPRPHPGHGGDIHSVSVKGSEVPGHQDKNTEFKMTGAKPVYSPHPPNKKKKTDNCLFVPQLLGYLSLQIKTFLKFVIMSDWNYRMFCTICGLWLVA